MTARNWRDLALIVSVIINVFILGAMVGAGARGGRDGFPRYGAGMPPGGSAEFSPMRFIMALPPDQRREAGRRIRGERDEMRPLFEEVAAARADLFDALTAEEFDADAARAALERSRLAEGAIRAHSEQVMVEILEPLSYEDRFEALVAARNRDHRPPPRFRRGGRRHHGERDDEPPRPEPED